MTESCHGARADGCWLDEGFADPVPNQCAKVVGPPGSVLRLLESQEPMMLANDAARDQWLRGIVVELHGEGEHQVVEILVQRSEVEAEDVTGGIDGV